MPAWLEATFAAICGLGVLGGVFWFTFARAPARRSDGGVSKNHGEGWFLTRGDGGGPSS
jgi:hypothetical protein